MKCVSMFSANSTVRTFEALGDAIENTSTIPILPLIEGTSQISLLIQSLGGILSFAATDLNQMIHVLQSKGTAAGLSVLEDMDLDDKELRYALTRQVWLLEFVSTLLATLSNHPEKTLIDCARMAYKQSLSPHHNFLIRAAVSAALFLLPSRAAFEKMLWDENDTAGALGAKLKKFCACINVTSAHLSALLL